MHEIRESIEIPITRVHRFGEERGGGRFRTVALTKRRLSSPTPADTVGGSPKTSTNSTPRQDLRDVPKIYKICSASAWREAERQGVYRGSADDLRDGFIHFSTAAQVPETARKHFLGQTALFLVEVEEAALGNSLRWERSRNEQLFPHLYGELDLGAVTAVHQIQARADGTHDIPELKP
jgi:uncharacterized protein (DUF952 family)